MSHRHHNQVRFIPKGNYTRQRIHIQRAYTGAYTVPQQAQCIKKNLATKGITKMSLQMVPRTAEA